MKQADDMQPLYEPGTLDLHPAWRDQDYRLNVDALTRAIDEGRVRFEVDVDAQGKPWAVSVAVTGRLHG